MRETRSAAAVLFATLLVIGTTVGAVVFWRTDLDDARGAQLEAAVAQGPPAAAPGEPCSAIRGWSSTQGERIRAEKKAAYQANPEYAALPGNNAGDYAYSSQPVDVPGPGTYTFDFGPLDPDQFTYVSGPVSRLHPPGPGIVLYFPYDYPVIHSAAAETSIVVKDGARYLRQQIELSGEVRPCTQLVVWLS